MRRQLPTWTLSKQAWLARLEREVVVVGRGHSPTPCTCMRLGWTQWVRAATSGELLAGECLTEAGRAQLKEWRQTK